MKRLARRCAVEACRSCCSLSRSIPSARPSASGSSVPATSSRGRPVDEVMKTDVPLSAPVGPRPGWIFALRWGDPPGTVMHDGFPHASIRAGRPDWNRRGRIGRNGAEIFACYAPRGCCSAICSSQTASGLPSSLHRSREIGGCLRGRRQGAARATPPRPARPASRRAAPAFARSSRRPGLSPRPACARSSNRAG